MDGHACIMMEITVSARKAGHTQMRMTTDAAEVRSLGVRSHSLVPSRVDVDGVRSQRDQQHSPSTKRKTKEKTKEKMMEDWLTIGWGCRVAGLHFSAKWGV